MYVSSNNYCYTTLHTFRDSCNVEPEMQWRNKRCCFCNGERRNSGLHVLVVARRCNNRHHQWPWSGNIHLPCDGCVRMFIHGYGHSYATGYPCGFSGSIECEMQRRNYRIGHGCRFWRNRNIFLFLDPWQCHHRFDQRNCSRHLYLCCKRCKRLHDHND